MTVEDALMRAGVGYDVAHAIALAVPSDAAAERRLCDLAGRFEDAAGLLHVATPCEKRSGVAS